MMELIESAIPVIQHALPPLAPLGLPEVQREAAVNASCAPATSEEPGDSGGHPPEAAEPEAVAHLHRALERLRTLHAQLTSGALLQQSYRQVRHEPEDSRPATKALSVKG